MVQRVPVKIVLDPNPALGALVRPGMSVEATIDTGAPLDRRSERSRAAVNAVRSRRLLRPRRAALRAFADAHPQFALNATRCAPMSASSGVLFGSIMSTLGSRVTNFGIADLRGGLHLGFDEGAWITTSFGVGQMLIGVSCPYLGAIFGVRRVLLLGHHSVFRRKPAGPLSPNLEAFLTAKFLGGVGSGTFIPLTISFVARSLPPRLVIYGLAVYAMNSELSQNVGASLEGWYADNWSWRWIDWQYCLALPLMFACIMVRDPTRENQ